MEKTSKQYFTTGEVASFCGVTLRTVINWIKQGRLPAHQLPGTRKDNRISRHDLVIFMQDNGLPLAQELTDEMTKAELPQTKQLATASEKSTVTTADETNSTPIALVVDDDISMAKAIGRVLRSHGMQVHLAHNGFEAGRQFERLQPALMTLDLNMPKMDGFAVLDALREREVCKILVISALGDTYMQQALAKNADDVMAKPFDNEALLARVERLLASS